jgi:RND family efflux transporter MFP subunit
MSKLTPVPSNDDAERSASQPSAPPRSDYSRAATVGWLALVILVGGLAYGAGTHVQSEMSAEARTAARAAMVPTVRTVTAQKLVGTVPLDLPGSVEPIETAAINARASGYIAKRFVDIGQTVNAGDVMAVIQSRELDQQVSQAEAALAQARANLDLAHTTAARSASLVKVGAISSQKFDEDRLTENARAADVKAAEASLAAITQRRDYLTVAAPFDGVVTARNVEVGDLVSADVAAARPLFSLARINRVKVQVRVPQDAADGLQENVPAVVTIPELAGRSFKGVVARTARALDSGSRTLLTEVDIDNPDNVLTAGLYANVHFDLTPSRPRVRLDANALIYRADGLKVAVVEGDHVRLAPVRLGRDFGAEVEIAEGLAGGETVVVNPSASLRDGSAVRLAAAN